MHTMSKIYPQNFYTVVVPTLAVGVKLENPESFNALSI